MAILGGTEDAKGVGEALSKFINGEPFLSIALIPPGCRLAAADVNGDTAVNTVDVVAIQRFFLAFTTGTANVGKYSFTPTNRSYPAIATNRSRASTSLAAPPAS